MKDLINWTRLRLDIRHKNWIVALMAMLAIGGFTANATGGARDTVPGTSALGLLGALPGHHDPVPCYGSGNANSRYTGQTNYNYIVENAYRGNSLPACNALPSCSFMDSQSTSAFYAALGFAALGIFTAPVLPLSIAAGVGAMVLGIYSYRASNTPCGI